jgi:hypothetical protein
MFKGSQLFRKMFYISETYLGGISPNVSAVSTLRQAVNPGVALEAGIVCIRQPHDS